MEATSRTRWLVSLLAIAGTLPYITLKLLWLGGSRVGLNDPEFGTSTVMKVANALTMGMDAVAVLMALAFVTQWGRRLPGWVVLLPMWIGTGLLAPILVIVPMQLVVGASSATDEPVTQPIADWVYAMVYGGFMWQGLFLLTGFLLYARHRWGARLGWHLRTPGRLVDRSDVPVLVVVFGLLLAGGLALISHVYGAFRPQAVNIVGDASLVVAAALGIALLTGLLGHRLPRWVGIVLAWTGTGAMASWALYLTVVLITPNDFQDGNGIALADVGAELIRLIAGLVAAGFALALVQRRAEATCRATDDQELVAGRRT